MGRAWCCPVESDRAADPHAAGTIRVSCRRIPPSRATSTRRACPAWICYNHTPSHGEGGPARPRAAARPTAPPRHRSPPEGCDGSQSRTSPRRLCGSAALRLGVKMRAPPSIRSRCTQTPSRAHPKPVPTDPKSPPQRREGDNAPGPEPRPKAKRPADAPTDRSGSASSGTESPPGCGAVRAGLLHGCGRAGDRDHLRAGCRR